MTGWGDVREHDTMPARPALPFTLRPGDTPARSTLALVRARWWLVGALGAIWIVSGALRGGLQGALTSALGVLGLVLLVTVIVVAGVRIVSRHRITVTETELVVQRLRRRRLPRAEVGELVVGYFTVRPVDPAGLQACITTREGERFATLTIISWPTGGLLEVAAALGIEVRDQDPERDQGLRPLWIRRPLLFQLGLGLGLMVVILGSVLTVRAVAG